MHKLAVTINSGTSLFIDLVFKDHENNIVNPISMIWNIKDITGAVIIADTTVTEFVDGEYTIEIDSVSNMIINDENYSEVRVVNITYTYDEINQYVLTEDAFYEIKSLV